MRLWTMAAAAAGFLAMTTAAHAEAGFLQIKGQKTGEMKGDVMQKGHESWNSVLSMDYSFNAPAEAGAGLATARRVRQPISFTLRWSKATPLLLNAAASNETLSEVQFQRWLPNATGNGTEVDADHIQLTNARITSLKIVDQKDDDGKLDTVVIVTLAYQKLTLTHQDGGISADDSWQ